MVDSNECPTCSGETISQFKIILSLDGKIRCLDCGNVIGEWGMNLGKRLTY